MSRKKRLLPWAAIALFVMTAQVAHGDALLEVATQILKVDSISVGCSEVHQLNFEDQKAVRRYDLRVPQPSVS
jgi:hypothetical protein